MFLNAAALPCSESEKPAYKHFCLFIIKYDSKDRYENVWLLGFFLRTSKTTLQQALARKTAVLYLC